MSSKNDPSNDYGPEPGPTSDSTLEPGIATAADATAAAPDLPPSGIEPLRHYLYVGFYEKRAMADLRAHPAEQPLVWQG